MSHMGANRNHYSPVRISSSSDFPHTAFICADERIAGECPDAFDYSPTSAESRCTSEQWPTAVYQCGTRLAGYAGRACSECSDGSPRSFAELYAAAHSRSTIL